MIKINRLFIVLLVLTLSVSFSVEKDIENSEKLASLQSQYVPISKKYPGILVGPQNGSINIELVYDPVCDGSADLDVVIRDLVANLDKTTLSQVNFKFVINALPYHFLSFKIASAIRYVNDQLGGQVALDTLRYFLQHISDWNEGSSTVANNSLTTVMNNIAGTVSTLTGLKKEEIRKEIAHYSSTDGLTRQWIKFSMGSLRMPGTPNMIINGARVDGGPDMSSQQIADLIKKLL